MSVVKFPTTNNELILTRRLIGLREDLNEYWAGLEEIHGHLHTMEMITQETEKEYNFLIKELARIRGSIDNIPLDMLEYATNIQIDGDSLKFIEGDDE